MGDFQGQQVYFTRGYFYAPESTTSRGFVHCENIRCTQPISTYEYPILPHLTPSYPILPHVEHCSIAQLNDYVAYVSHISCPSVFLYGIPTMLPVETHQKTTIFSTFPLFYQ